MYDAIKLSKEGVHLLRKATEEPWKAKHDHALRVLTLEGILERLDSSLTYIEKTDIHLHTNAKETAESGVLDKWMKDVASMSKELSAVVKWLGREADRLDAHSYREARITPAVLNDLRRRIQHLAEGAREWNDWKPPA